MKIKKIGGVIIMHKNHNNYGTALQGFATVKTIQKLNYNLRIIRYQKKRSIKTFLSIAPFWLISGGFKQIFRHIKNKFKKIKNQEYFNGYKIRTQKMNLFKDTFFSPLIDTYYGFEELKNGSKKYDTIFVGSDQVWSPLSLYAHFYNLLFVDKMTPKFSYASSFGVSTILFWQKQGTAKYLNKLNIIGVREIRGKEIVEELTSKTAQVVLDPTFLLTKNEWIDYTQQSKFNIKEPYIFCYILGDREDIRQEICKLKEQSGYKIVALNHMDNFIEADINFGDITPYDVDAFDFIKLLSNATYVCTDSFHGTIFSLLFHKQFMTFYRHKKVSSKSTQSRIDSILKIFSCESRLFNFNGKDLKTSIEQPINYDYFENKLTTLRQESLDFLKKGLELSKEKCND